MRYSKQFHKLLNIDTEVHNLQYKHCNKLTNKWFFGTLNSNYKLKTRQTLNKLAGERGKRRKKQSLKSNP